MARAKRASDEVYNARRRAKRLLSRLERDMQGQSRSERAATRAYIDKVRQEIQATYTPRKGSPAVRRAMLSEAASHAQQLDRMTRNVRGNNTASARTNQLFSRQLNAARLEKQSTLGKFGTQEVSIFYAATRRIWQGKDARRRNELIMEALGTTSLREAFTQVLYQNREALRIATRKEPVTSKVLGITSENEDFYNEVGIDSERQGSPIWESYLNLIG